MNTTIYLGSVKWNNKYTHVVDFQTETKRRAWFMHNFIEHAKTTKLLDREQGELETDVLTYNEMLERGYNYMYVEEFDERVDKTFKWFAFIVALERTNKDTVVIRYELDYWQTYFFKPNGEKAATDILDAFVKREHQDRWVKNGSKLSPIWSRTIEGIEVGDMVKVADTPITYKVLNTNGEEIDINDLRLTPFLVFYDYFKGADKDQEVKKQSININGYSPSIPAFLVFNYGGNMLHNKRLDIKIDDKVYLLANFKGHLGVPFTPSPDYPSVGLMKDFMVSSEKVLAINKVNYLPFKFKVVSEYDDRVVIEAVGNVVLEPHVYNLAPSTNRAYALMIKEVKKNTTPLYNFYKHEINTTPNIYLVPNRSYEPKLLTQEFELNKITNIRSDVLNVLNENIDDGCSMYIANSLDLWNYEQITLDNYNNNDFYNRLRTKNNNEMLLTNEPYLNYINNNRNQIAVQQTLGVVSTAIGVASLGVGAGALMTGATGMLGKGMALGLLVGGVHQTTSGLGGIASEFARQSDYKNKVDEVKGSQNTLMLDVIDDADYYHVVKYRVREQFLDKAYSLFLKQGYLANEYKKPELNSRYYFNYIQCSYVEINPLAIPQDAVRRIIENIYLNGTTIWHYRNPSTFRLIDYRLENWEMSLNPSGQ